MFHGYAGNVKVRALTGIDGGALGEWRRSRGWDVPKTARELRHAASEPVAAHHAHDDASSVTAWVAATNTTDDTIEEMDRAAAYLAEVHAEVPARKVLSEVLALNRYVHTLLRSGRQRLRQTRRLLQVHSRLMAHACVLLGDLGRGLAARQYGNAALMLAQEAEADEAIAWNVQAKTARWTGGFVEAAEFAWRGFEVSRPTATKVELAYREANAIALFGDAPRARKALQQAEPAAEALDTGTPGVSVWSFPPGRQALFSLSVALHTGDAAGALHAASSAEASWSSGAPRALATWARVRAGAAMAYLMLDQPRFAGSSQAIVFRQQISDFLSAPAAC